MRGVPMLLHEHEAVCDAIRAAGDFYEAPILDALRARRPAEATILDVGAHIGNHSLYWAAFVPHTAIVAFEPVDLNYGLLEANLASVPTAVAVPVAITDHRDGARMTIDYVNTGRSHIDPGGEVVVRTLPLDAFVFAAVSLVKIDVEGWQASVLRGAASTLHRHHPALLVEDQEGEVAPALAQLGLGGYRCSASFDGANYLWEWA